MTLDSVLQSWSPLLSFLCPPSDGFSYPSGWWQHPYPLHLQSQKLTSVDIINISVTCLTGEKWRMVMTQNFKPFENRE